MMYLIALLVQLGAPLAVASQYAEILDREAQHTGIPAAVVAATCGHESRFRVHARGAQGAIGLCQLLRGTLATRGYEHLSNKQLEAPAIQFHLAARHLAYLRKVCGGGAPVRWLSPYSGRQCGTSRYSRAILRELARAAARVPRSSPTVVAGGVAAVSMVSTDRPIPPRTHMRGCAPC